MVYKWKNGSRISADATLIGKELDKIKVRTPEAIVQAAKDKKKELHKCFTWDESAAAHQWRLQEARQVVNSIIIVEEREPETVEYRAYESVVINDRRQYVAKEVWQNDDDLRLQVFNSINIGIAELQRKATTYRHLDEERMDKLQLKLGDAKEAIAG